ncbi:MAG: response regulator [Candidatus Aminicenantales bacterium]
MADTLEILVIDDEEDICRIFVKYLTLRGHRVQYALTGGKGIKKVQKKHYDIVFLNIVLPGIKGLEVLERIKEISPRSKVIVITGKIIQREPLSLLRKKGASATLKKPFSLEDIEEAIR